MAALRNRTSFVALQFRHTNPLDTRIPPFLTILDVFVPNPPEISENPRVSVAQYRPPFPTRAQMDSAMPHRCWFVGLMVRDGDKFQEVDHTMGADTDSGRPTWDHTHIMASGVGIARTLLWRSRTAPIFSPRFHTLSF